MNELLKKIRLKDASAFTHSGKFHADDVFSSALLLYLNPEITILRGNKVPEYGNQLQDFVFREFLRSACQHVHFQGNGQIYCQGSFRQH